MSFAASDLWKLHNSESRSSASNVNLLVSSPLINCGLRISQPLACYATQTNRNNSREKVLAQQISARAKLVNATHENDGKLEHFMPQFD